jgi:hypothetical protein
MPAISRDDLNLMYALIDRMTETESQNKGLIIEMCQTMIGDLIETGQLKPLADYVARYSYLPRAESEALAASIYPDRQTTNTVEYESGYKEANSAPLEMILIYAHAENDFQRGWNANITERTNSSDPGSSTFIP